MARTVASRRRKIAAIATAGLLTATACTSSHNAGNPGGGGEISSFTIGHAGQITTLDPTSASVFVNVTDMVAAPLGEFKTDGTLVPDLAAHITNTAGQITFDLRPDARFSDGAPVTADDVVYSLNRVLASTLYGPGLKAVKGVAAQGTNRVVVTVGTPDTTVLPNLILQSQVLEKKQVEAAGGKFGSPSVPPVGAGPYKVASFTTSKLTLVRNDRYWGSAPNIKSLSYVNVPDANTAQLAMRAGTINLYWDTTAAQIKAWAGVPGATTTVVPSISTRFLGMDVTHAPFDDAHVRRAVAHAIDRRGLVAAAFAGHANLIKTVITPTQLASVSSADTANQFLDTLPGYDFDLAKARAELAQSRYPNGFSVTLPVLTTDSISEAAAESMAQTMKPLGIAITVKPEARDAWVNDIIHNPDKGMQFLEFNADAPQPGTMLPFIVGSGPIATVNNLSHYAPAQLDPSVSTLMTSASAAEQFDATKNILTSMATDVPYVPLFNPDYLVVTSKGFALSKSTDLDDILYANRLAFDITATS